MVDEVSELGLPPNVIDLLVNQWNITKLHPPQAEALPVALLPFTYARGCGLERALGGLAAGGARGGRDGRAGGGGDAVAPPHAQAALVQHHGRRPLRPRQDHDDQRALSRVAGRRGLPVKGVGGGAGGGDARHRQLARVRAPRPALEHRPPRHARRHTRIRRQARF